ncbi:MAG: vitamin K epoxide reductase family protein [Acidimicrobiaceae bacterium]|nr:vitamin K epoxide reductase family protein [Acidimicrobiaceae bacterium]
MTDNSVELNRPVWLRAASLILSIFGLGVSVYLTIAHYTASVILACPENATINCQKVTTSAESQILGVPVALLGLIFYVAMVAICLPQAWKVARLEPIRLAMSGVGVLFVLWLVYSELVLIKAICLWCTSVHVVTIGIFLCLLYGFMTYPRPSE